MPGPSRTSFWIGSEQLADNTSTEFRHPALISTLPETAGFERGSDGMKNGIMWLHLFAVGVLVLACGPDATEQDIVQDIVEDTHSLDDEIRLNQIQFKGTHNSYKIATDFCPPEWCLTMPPLNEQLQDLGVRSVELDLHMNADGTLDVFHLALMDDLSTCRKFKNCLTLVKDWSDAHAGHLPIFILIEPKDEHDEESLTLLGKLGVVESEILSVFGRSRVITPDDVRGEHATLRDAITTDGWPTLRNCRDRVMFVMLDNSEHLQENLEMHSNLEGAIIFPRNGRGESWSSFLEIGDPSTAEAEAALKAAVLEDYIIRVTLDSPETTIEQFEQASAATLRAGVQLIDTDHPTETTVPHEEGQGFRFDIPDGNPARCNPVNAPEACTPEAVENLR